MSNTDQQLRQAANLIREQRLYEAREILNLVTGLEPNNVEAWWLLANAQSDPNAMRDALQIVLRLQPGNTQAQQRLAALDRQSPSPASGAGTIGTTSPTGTAAAPLSLEDLLSDSGTVAQVTPAGGPGYGYGAGMPPIVSRRRSPCLTMFLAMIMIGLCSCVGIVALFGVGFAAISRDPTVAAGFSTIASILNMPDKLPAGAVDAGVISASEPRTANMSGGPNIFTYNANAGETVAISAQIEGIQDADIPIMIGIYDVGGKKLASSNLFDFNTINLNRTPVAGTPVRVFTNKLTYTFKNAGPIRILVQNWPDTNILYQVRVDPQ